jgi:hypothetical protein
MPLGCKVTLRGDRMYEFLDRLINVALPRVRDFRGVKGSSFDGRGNYAMGLKEHIVFPEIDFDKVDEILGHGHHHLHHREDRRGSEGAVEALQHALQRLIAGTKDMAKKSMVNREVKRAKLVKQHAAKRAALKAVINDQTKPMEERFKATPETGDAAPQLVGRADPQPLPADGPSACVLSQAQTVADHAARAGLVRPDPRHGQVELVREESTMSMNDPLGDMLTRIRNAQMRGKSVVRLARLDAARPRAGRAAVRRLHPRLSKRSTANGQGEFEISLKYYEGEPVIRETEARVQARPPRLHGRQGAPLGPQRPGHLDRLHAEGRDVGCKRTRCQCRRRSALHRVLRRGPCLVSARNPSR